MERTFKYAILRLLPEPYRGEQVNIGVVVFARERLDLRLTIHASVVRTFGVEPDALRWIPEALAQADDARLTVDERWTALLDFPGLSLSDIGWFMADGATQYEERLQRIRSDYIDRPSAPKRPKRSTSLSKQLREEFRHHQIMGRHPGDLDNHKVVANVAVGPNARLNIDFLAKNGKFHATETVDFSRANEAGVPELKQAALAAYTLRFAKKELGPTLTCCYFVYAATNFVENGIYPAIAMVEADVDRIFNMQSQVDRQKYFDLMLEALGSPRLFDAYGS